MRIEQISCTQFAGIHDRKISFENGINVLLGKNETGKSTVVDLIYHLLYHNVDAKQNEKKEKDFKARFYPKGISLQGDYIDGTLTLCSAEGQYILSKGWGTDAYVQLITPQNIRVRSQETINGILGQLLQYRKGLYDDVVFAPQRKQEELVSHVFQSVAGRRKATSKDVSSAKTDLLYIIAQETIKNAGVDANSFEHQLAAIIESFEGCWDTKKGIPKASSLRTKRNGDRPKNEGKLFLAFYAVEQLTQMLTDARKAEIAVDRDMRELQLHERKLQEAEEKREQFEVFASQLAEYNANILLIAHLKEEIKRRRQAAKDYPVWQRAFSKASKLRQELREVEALELYESIAQKRAEWDEAKALVASIRPVTTEVVQQAERLEKTLQYTRRRQFNMDILAQLQNSGYDSIEIRSLSDNRVIHTIHPGDELRDFDIIEPVEIVVPYRMRLRLSNHANGFRGRRYSVDSCAQELDELYKSFGVYSGDIRELQKKKEDYDAAVSRLSRKEAVYRTALGNRDWEVMEETFHNLSRRKKRRQLAEILEDIKQICGEQSVESYCGELNASIKAIEDTYKEEIGEITSDALRASAAACQDQLHTATEAVSAVDNIPPQYKRIKDVSQYRAQLKGEIDTIKSKIGEIEARLQENQKYLGKKTAEEYATDLEQAKSDMEKVRATYEHWIHIREAFRIARDKAGSSTEIKDVENKFAEYLKLITGGRVILRSLDENMDVSITSNNSQLDEIILSEGTKDTIALAFRLAMLEHIFPNGGGFLVLDDPFTDMDKDRTEQACRLVGKFAEKGNQVIFTTCSESVAQVLGGNLIRFS